MPFNLGFIGGGNMSTAIAKGILNKGAHPANKIWVSGPNIENLKHWTDFGANVTTKNGEIITKCDIVFLGVKPGMLLAAINDCASCICQPCEPKTVLLVSMLAGINISDIQKAVTCLAPMDIRIIRIMPNTPMTVGAGACLLTPDGSVTPEQCDIVEKLLRSCGICERISEKLMDSGGALVGCGPAYIYMMIEALADGAVKQGVPRASAQRLAAQMVMGSGKMVLESGKHPGLLKDEVCSPGGSTIAGVAVLEQGKMRSVFINAIEASTQRNKELGK